MTLLVICPVSRMVRTIQIWRSLRPCDCKHIRPDVTDPFVNGESATEVQRNERSAGPFLVAPVGVDSIRVLFVEIPPAIDANNPVALLHPVDTRVWGSWLRCPRRSQVGARSQPGAATDRLQARSSGSPRPGSARFRSAAPDRARIGWHHRDRGGRWLIPDGRGMSIPARCARRLILSRRFLMATW